MSKLIIPISFAGKTIMVTGAGRGLGKTIVGALVKNGGKVIAVTRTAENLKNLQAELPSIVPLLVDVSNLEETKEAIQSVGQIDMLVNNAGVNIKGLMLKAKADDFHKVFNTNALASLNTFQAVAQGMLDRKIPGSIVNVSSVSVRTASMKQGIYSASKAALDALTVYMAMEVGRNNIRVNSINPGLFPSDITKDTVNNPNNPLMVAVRERVYLGRIASKEEVANLALFLLSDYSSYITGENIFISGGKY